MTLEQVKKRKLTKAEKDDLKRLAGMPDEKINTSDIPEVTDFTGWKRGALYRPVTRPVTIRMNAPDLAVAQELSKLNGLPYQTYISSYSTTHWFESAQLPLSAAEGHQMRQAG